MGRIRTIKPEVAESESLGRVTRDARLLFILLWTIADDEGRLRGNPAYIAGALFPYDGDSREFVEPSLRLLADEGMIRRYVAEGNSYIQITNWVLHQKIDRPTKSKIPPFEPVALTILPDSTKAREDSRGLDEGSCTDQDQDQDQDQEREIPPTPKGGIQDGFDPLQAELPGNLQSPQGRRLWEDWIAHRKEKRFSLKERCIHAQLEELAECQDPLSVLRRNVASGYQGLIVRQEDKRKTPVAVGAARRPA